jgi:hypothetical protein
MNVPGLGEQEQKVKVPAQPDRRHTDERLSASIGLALFSGAALVVLVPVLFSIFGFAVRLFLWAAGFRTLF